MAGCNVVSGLKLCTHITISLSESRSNFEAHGWWCAVVGHICHITYQHVRVHFKCAWLFNGVAVAACVAVCARARRVDRTPARTRHSGHDSRVVYWLVWRGVQFVQHAHSYCRSSLKIRRAANVKPQFLTRKTLLYRVTSRAPRPDGLRVPLVRTTVIPPGTRLQPTRTPTRLFSQDDA